MNINLLLEDLRVVIRYMEDGEDENAYEELCRIVTEVDIIVSREEKENTQATDEVRDCIPDE